MSWRIAPVLVVRSVQVAVEYYTSTLGFELIGSFGVPMEMAFVGKNGVQIMLQDSESQPTPGPNSSYKSIAWDVLLWVDDVEGLYAELTANGATVTKAPHKTFYGSLEIEVLDPDGHVLCFSQAREAGT